VRIDFWYGNQTKRILKRNTIMSNEMTHQDNYWEQLSSKIKNPVQTKNKRPDTSDIEIPFLLDFVKQADDVLDIGSGSGLIINKLVDHVKQITAVEKFEGFTKFILNTEKIFVIHADLRGFKLRKQFDVVLSFGVAQCFAEKEAYEIYKNCFDMVKPGGKMIVRVHCALEEDKTVDGFSEELQTNYFAQYRNVEKEMSYLKNLGFNSVEKFDIFSDELNVWKDTRHFIFVCEK
jgi:SAM-dependent methyltransferase